MTKLLLDTHAAVWWLGDRSKLADEAHEAIADVDNDVYVSAASIWEIEVKRAAGRLKTPNPMAEAAQATGLLELPVTWRHAERAAHLPPHHTDPFDRMLVAQAQLEGFTIVTRDKHVSRYQVAVLPA